VDARSDWPFTGRAEELAVVTDSLSAVGGAPTGAVIVAPAGVGKTRMLHEVRAWAERGGLPTATVIATMAAASTPYGAMLHLLPDSVRDADSDVSTWYSAFARSLIRDGVPPVLLVDDAHLLDPGSAALVLHLALQRAVVPVVAVRGDVPVADPITSLWKDGLTLRVDLQPFSPREVAQLLEDSLGAPLSPRSMHRLYEVCRGNVLYVRELVLAAVESGSLARLDGIWRWDEAVVPAPRLADAVGRRLEDLAPEDLEALGTVALGEPLPLAAAEDLIAGPSLSRLEQTGRIRVEQDGAETDVFRLGHPLYGETVLARIGHAGRRRLVRRLADTLAAHSNDPIDALRVTRWRLESGVPVASEALVAAARTANHRFDPALARRLAKEAIERQAGPAAYVELARALSGLGAFAEAEATLARHEVEILGDSSDRLHLRYLDCRFRTLYRGLGQRERTLGALDRFLAAHSGRTRRDLEAQHLVTAYRATIHLDEGATETCLAELGPVVADEQADELTRLNALEAAGEAMAYLGRRSDAAPILTALTRLGREGSPAVARAKTDPILQQILGLLLDGRVREAEPLVTAAHSALTSDPDGTTRGLAALAVGKVRLMQGRPVSARALFLDAAHDFAGADSGGARAWALAMLAEAMARSGDLAAARSRRDESIRARLPRWVARNEEDFTGADVWIAVSEGRLHDAVERALQGADLIPGLPLLRVRLLHLAVRLGLPPARVLDVVREIADATEPTYPALVLAHLEALAADDGSALEGVAERFAERGLNVEAAESAALAAVAHRRAGIPAAATRAASRSAALAETCEGTRTPAMSGTPTPAGLSRREGEVARLAAAGLSNSEIAARLGLSVRTVESHLYQVFAKLGLDHRDQIAAHLGTGTQPGNSVPHH
jgi:DNA-binding NarL/FixJ family response regulator